MKDNHTDITIVLDRSGSMESIKNDAIGGFNTFLDDQKKVQGTASITLNQFDNEFENVVDGKDIQSVEPLTDKTFVPRGSTALLDAVGRSINETGARLDKLEDKDKPAMILFVILTDGYENASREFNYGRIKTMIEHQRDKYNWQFVFLGAGIDAFSTGDLMGINSAQTMTVADNAIGTQSAFSSISSNVSRYRSTGNVQNLNFTPEDYKKQKKAGAKY